MTTTKGIVLTVLLALSLGPYASEALAQGPTPLFACGSLTSGSYVLAQNIFSPGGTCFTLLENNITINFNGHTITGTGVGQGITEVIATGNLSGIRIGVGTIRNFFNGINLPTSSVYVELMQVLNNADDGIRVGVGSIVRGNIANNNGDDGIQVFCPCLISGNAAVGNLGNDFENIGAGCKKFENLF